MAKYISLLNHYKADIGIILLASGVHLWYLFSTTFVDWPEMLLFPWFLSKNLMYYRDVAIAYAPGANYILHALYLLLGYSVQSERAIAYAFTILTDMLVYVGARTLTRSRWAAAAALFFFVLWQPIFSGNTIWYETMLAPLYLVAYIMLLTYGEKKPVRFIVSIGLVLGAATLIKQTALWPVSAICLYVWLSHKRKKEGFVHAMYIAAIVVAVNLLMWGYFALLGAGSEYRYWVFESLIAFSRSSSLYALAPARNEIVLILPAVLSLAFLLLLRPNKQVWLLVLLTVAVLAAGLPRWSLHRLQPMLVFASLGFGLMCMKIASSKRTWVTLGCIVLILIAAGSYRSYRVFITLRDPMQPQFFGGQYQEILSYIRQNAPGPVFVFGNYYHLYFGLDERPAVLPWVPLFPLSAELPGMQKQLVASLEENTVPYVVYIPFHPDTGYYLDYIPTELLLYVRTKYEKIGAPPVAGGELLKRR